jgi:ABC-type multidrug transport system fused ATPase/permease subunit
VYSERSIVVMDDPLSAVDAHVGAALFDDCICGALAGRTRVFVTHQSQLLPQADYVVLMEACQITFAGTVEELRATGHALAPVEVEAAPAVAPTVAVEVEAFATVSPPMQSLMPERGAGQHDRRKSITDSAACVGRGLMTAEETAIGSVPWATYGWYVGLGGVGNFAAMAAIALAAQAAFTIANLILARWSSMQPVVAGVAVWSHVQYLQWMGIFTALGLIFLCARQVVYARFITSAAGNLHDALTRNVLRAPTFFFDTTPMGRIINRFTKDMTTVDASVSETLGLLFNMVSTLLGTVFLVCYSSAWLILIFPPIALVFVFVYRYYTRTVRGIKRLDSVLSSPMLAIMNEAVGGLSSIRVYQLSRMLTRTHEARVLAALQPAYNMRCAQRWIASRNELLGAAIIFFCMLLGVLSRTALKDSLPLSPAMIALAISNAISTTHTVSQLTRTLSTLETDMASTQRLQQYSAEIPQEATLEYAGEHLNAPADAPTRPEADWPVTPAVAFENFNLRYRPGLPLILSSVNVVFEARHKIGVVGRTGSGKSTMLLAMFRMIEAASGKIVIGGRDISTLKLCDLRKAITIIPQDPMLFCGTVRSNLDPFHEHSDEAVWAVIDRLQLRPRMMAAATTTTVGGGGATRPSPGLDTPVGEKGGNFSLGQRQLLCMARALLKRSPILMLDEATASVDFETDAMIQRLIREEFKDCTVITIAHRLATIMDSDRVLVLSRGEVAEFGKPADLLRCGDGGHFYGMVKKLGPAQFDALVDVAEGRADVCGNVLQMDTVYASS